MKNSTILLAGTSVHLVLCGFLLLLSCVLTACMDKSNGTIVLPIGTVSNNVIPDEIRDVLEDKIPIYEGNDIPNISGYYLQDDVTALYCSDEGNIGYKKLIEYLTDKVSLEASIVNRTQVPNLQYSKSLEGTWKNWTFLN